MKKGFFAILAVLMVFAMVTTGCGDGSDSGKDNNIPAGKWRVTFKYDGGTPASPAHKDVPKGEAVGELPEPTKTGYVLAGWFEDENTQWDADTLVKKNVVLKASWLEEGTVIRCEITFDKNADNATEPNPKTKTVISGGRVALPTEPTRPGYIFGGWNRESDGTGAEFTNTTDVKASYTVYAKWIQGYRVTFDKNGGIAEAEPKTKDVIPPATKVDSLPTTSPTRANFNFKGWNMSPNGTGDAFTEATEVTASITVYAWWEFVGGTIQKGEGTLVHTAPMFEVYNNSGAVINLSDGSITLKQNNDVQYKFPAEAYAADGVTPAYDFFKVDFSIKTGDGTATVVNLRQYGGNTPYGAWSNATGNFQLSGAGINPVILEISGAGNSGGFLIHGNTASTNCTFTVNSIIFATVPKYDITFDIGYEGGTSPEKVTGVWGANAGHPGHSLGSAFPAAPDRTTEDPPQ
jgi:uncharacterized repeat protein (TIGR02543 family)